jgi:hypothetical protein
MDLQPLSVRDAVPSLQAIAAQSVQNLADHPTHDNLETIINGIPLFLHLLGGSSSSNSSSEQHLTSCAAAALCTLASKHSTRSMLLGAGCLSHLLQTMSNSSGSISAATTPAAKAAAEVLACLAVHKDSRAALVEAGGITTMLGIIQGVLQYDSSTASLPGRDHILRRIVTSSDSDSIIEFHHHDEDIPPGLEHDNAAIDVLLQAAAAFLDLHAASDTKQAATEAVMQHECGAGLVLELSRCRYTWLHDNGALGLRTQAVLFELLEQHEEYPAVWEGFLQAGGVGYLLDVLGDVGGFLGWAGRLPQYWRGLNENEKQRMKAVEAAANLAATAAGTAALGTPEMVECLLQISCAGDKQSAHPGGTPECLDHVCMHASLSV